MHPKINAPKPATVRKHLELINKKFGRLTVLSLEKHVHREYDNKNHFEPFYLCSCDCGNQILLARRALKYGNTQSCGCLREDSYTRFSKNRNISDKQFYEQQLYKRYVASAIRRSKEFNLDFVSFSSLVNNTCHYCGRIPYTSYKSVVPFKYKSTDNLYYNGIDRKDNRLGYIKNNVVTCCKECNNLKGVYGYVEFINLINRIHDYCRLNQ